MNLSKIKTGRVAEFDWSDPTLSRASLIPLAYYNNQYWIGISVGAVVDGLNTIGGTYDEKDFDLLETTIREAVEEIGDYLDLSKLKDFSTCKDLFALRIANIIAIFYPSEIPERKFIPTEEIAQMLWIPLSQLKTIKENAGLVFLNPREKIFVMSSDLQVLINPIIRTLEENPDPKTFQPIESNLVLTRKKKIVPPISQVAKIMDFNDLMRDLDNRWYLAYFVILPENVAIMSGSGNIYYIKREEFKPVTIKLKTFVNLRTFVSKVQSGEGWTRSLGLRVTALENEIATKQNSAVAEKFRKEIDEVRESNNFIRELELILKYENELHEYVVKNNVLRNERRSKTYKIISENNLLLLDWGSAPYSDGVTAVANDINWNKEDVQKYLDPLISYKIYRYDPVSNSYFF